MSSQAAGATAGLFKAAATAAALARAPGQPGRPRRVPSMRRLFLIDHLDLPTATGVEEARWEHFQIAHLDDLGAFRIEAKGRQIAWSWLIAAEAIADTHADLWGEEPRDSIFVSINLQEAAEKIRYARRVYETLAESAGIGAHMHPLERDSTLNLEFSNGARLTSLPARPPRGRSRANVYLDEFAHPRDDRAIYTAALPIISKGGRLRIGSSPFGAAGAFWEIFAQALRPYPGFTRKVTPWWTVYAFSLDPAEARRLAPTMTTAERVSRYGNKRIIAIYDNMILEDFNQEYECAFVDETRSYFTWEEIGEAQSADLTCEIATCTGGDIGAALAAIDALARHTETASAEHVLTAGYDVGRTRDTSELLIVGLSPAGSYPLRLMITLDRCPYDQQIAVLIYALENLPILRLWIDRNGIGNQLAEQTERAWPAVAEGRTFTNESKQLWATTAKRLFQQHRALLPASRDLAYQLHSIRKLISASRLNIFEVDANEKHHADKAWSLFLALAAAEAGRGQPQPDALAGAFSYTE